MSTIAQDIEAFLETHPEVTATSFGALALSDRHLVRQIRKGRRLWPETEAKVRRFMATYRPAPAPQADAA